MRVTEDLDSGPIALQERIAVGRDDYGALATRLAALGGDLLLRALDLRAEGELELAEQDDSLATYAERIEPPERRLDPTRRAIELERVVRALTPHIGAYLELQDAERLGVLAAEALPGRMGPGALEGGGEGELLLGCGEGVLRLREVRPAGGRAMDAEAYLRGHSLPRPA